MGDEAHGERIVLVVDDNPDICATVQMMLEYLGYAARVATDGEAALSMVAAEPFSAVLLDVEMPRMDGETTLARLRETHPDLPVVLCSGFDRGGARGPATTFLLKPYTFHDLSEALDRALAG